jgi:hypothetical protein
VFEKMLKAAFNDGGEVFVFIKGFTNPLRGRIQDMEGDYFSFFQNGKSGTILWAFRKKDVLSCGLLVGPPTHDGLDFAEEELESDGIYLNESDN